MSYPPGDHLNPILRDGGENEQSEYVLPSILPLSHSNSFLKSERDFDVDAFLLSRATHTSLPELRSELRNYFADLKAELVQLLNDDYESFLSLSTDLRSEGPRLMTMKLPMGVIRANIQESKDRLLSLQNTVEAKLAERASLREEKALIHLLLRVSDSTSRLEELLSGTMSAPSPAASQRVSGKPSQVKHLSRVASEYAQLLYLVRQAEVGNSTFVESLNPRLNRAKETLISLLDNIFADAMKAKPSSELERAKHMSDLNECLKIYDDLHLYREAERVLETEIISEFVKKVIHSSALTLPHSPVIPHTPLGLPHSQKSAFDPFLVPPQTPFTPFAPPLLSWNEIPDTTSLDSGDHPLGSFYAAVLRFLYREIKPLITLSEDLNDRRQREQETGERFDFLTNVVWDQVGRAIMDELGNNVFALGRPDEFQKNYLITQSFLSALESMSSSMQSVLAFRSHPVSQAFERRWQLTIYFQLRWKEIAVQLDESLISSITRLEEKSVEFPEAKEFGSKQALAVFKAVKRCWSQDVFLHELGWRIWRLTLQILERYKRWMSHVISQLDFPKVAQSRAAGSSSRAGTPDLNATDLTKETALLRQASVIVIDILALDKHLRRLWSEQISVLLPQAEMSSPSTEDILFGVLTKQKLMIEPVANVITSILCRRAREAVSPLRQLPSQFRAMSGKRVPTRPSEYVSGIMKPVRVFFGIGAAGDPQGAQLGELYTVQWATEVFESAIEEFASHYRAMRKNEELLRRLKKGKKTAFSLFNSASSAASSDDLVDEDRVRGQVLLDVEALGKDASSIGVVLEDSTAYQALRSLAQSKYDDVS